MGERKQKGTVLGKEITVQQARSDTNVLTSAVLGKPFGNSAM